MGEFVRVEIDQAIATIRLDRPPVNALNPQVQDEIAAAAAQVDTDPAVRAVVLYGGEKVFAAGADIKHMAEASFAQVAADSRRLQAAFTAVARIGKPVVAAVTGYALGGGLELALCADFRVVGAGARLGQPEILLGVIPGAGGTQRLPRLVGPARAKDIVYTGRFVPRRRRTRSAWSTKSSPTRRSTRPRASWLPGTRPAPRWPCARPSRPSTRAWRSTSTPGWRSSGCISPRSSRPRTSARECAVSSRMGRGRPRLPGVDAEVALRTPARRVKEHVSRCTR